MVAAKWGLTTDERERGPGHPVRLPRSCAANLKPVFGLVFAGSWVMVEHHHLDTLLMPAESASSEPAEFKAKC